jgi:hypothetical protein
MKQLRSLPNEDGLFPRSAEFVREAAQNHDRVFDDTAPQSAVDLYSKQLAKPKS